MRAHIYKITGIMVFALAMTMTSCSDFLDEEPKDFRTSSNFYVDEASLKTGLFGVYEKYYALYRANEPFIGELGTDETVAQFYHTTFNEMYKYNMTSNHEVVSRWFNLHYECITRANTIINRAPQVENVPEPSRAYIIAESRALRAWAYFRLAQTLGPLPLVLEETTVIDPQIARSPLKDVYKAIVDDLEFAAKEGNLPAQKHANEPGRLTSYAAKAMLGKVYLTMASSKEAKVIDKLMDKKGKQGYGYDAIEASSQDLYKKAETVLGDLVGKVNLHNEYGEVFLVENKNKISENLWELQFSSTYPGGSYFLKVYGMMSYPFLFERDMLTNGSGLSQIHYSPDMWTDYKEGDNRKGWNLADSYMDYNELGTDTFHVVFDPVEAHADGKVQSWLGITKYRFNKGLFNASIDYPDFYDLPMNFTVIRYADVLLMYAEASLKANGGTATQAGVDAINLVRNRARGMNIPPSNTPDFPNFTTSTLTLDAIMMERKLELCFESIRWFDLVRWGNLIEKYNEPLIAGDYKQAVIDEENYLYPIPQAQIDRAHNKEGFFQNPGY